LRTSTILAVRQKVYSGRSDPNRGRFFFTRFNTVTLKYQRDRSFVKRHGEMSYSGHNVTNTTRRVPRMLTVTKRRGNLHLLDARLIRDVRVGLAPRVGDDRAVLSSRNALDVRYHARLSSPGVGQEPIFGLDRVTVARAVQRTRSPKYRAGPRNAEQPDKAQ